MSTVVRSRIQHLLSINARSTLSTVTPHSILTATSEVNITIPILENSDIWRWRRKLGYEEYFHIMYDSTLTQEPNSHTKSLNFLSYYCMHPLTAKADFDSATKRGWSLGSNGRSPHQAPDFPLLKHHRQTSTQELGREQTLSAGSITKTRANL